MDMLPVLMLAGGTFLVLVLMVFLLVLMAYYLFTIVRQQRLADR